MSATSTILTVSELTQAIKNQLETRFSFVSVQGEISNFKPHSSGHLYFDLKDGEAKIPAVMFRPQAVSLPRLPKEGDQVRVKGSLSVYAPHGRYQLLIKQMDYAGVGELLLKLEELKKKLSSKGFFDLSRKRALPKFPKRIGVVTSPTGAVIRDIIHILSRRFAGFHLILNPVRVQGAESAAEIAAAIEHFNRYQLADVLIVGRGGGSLEDLWSFNEEVVAEAIFKSAIPIISAVGHETDVTIADFVADVRAPTPSAAAEMVLSEKAHHLLFLEKMRKNTSHSLIHQLRRYQEKLERWKQHPLFSSPLGLLSAPFQKIDEIRDKIDEKMHVFLFQKRVLLNAKKREVLALKPTVQLSFLKERNEKFANQLDVHFKNLLRFKKERLESLIEQLHALNPKNVLKRGFTILFDQKRTSVIVSTQEMTPGKKLRALLSDGEASLVVEDDKKTRT